jgi:hypothetical protein
MILQRSLGLLLLAAAACIVVQPRSALAQRFNPPPIQIQVISVTASNSSLGMDPELKKIPMTRLLPSLFAYTSYHMDSSKTQRTVCGRLLTFSLPAGHLLHIAPLRIDGERLNMQIELFDGNRPRLGMQALMENHATLILGGPHYPLGMIIVMVNADIVGSLPPAPPQLRMPPQRLPQTSRPQGENAIPQPPPPEPSDPGEVSPISAAR